MDGDYYENIVRTEYILRWQNWPFYLNASEWIMLIRIISMFAISDYCSNCYQYTESTLTSLKIHFECQKNTRKCHQNIIQSSSVLKLKQTTVTACQEWWF
jgi:hypothetical protein